MEKHPKTNDFYFSKQQDLWSSATDSVLSYSESSYFKTVLTFIRSNPFYKTWLKILMLFRRFRMLTYITTFISSIIALIGTGALLLVYISATLLLIIASTILLLLFIALTSFDIKRSNRDIKRALQGKEIYLFFSTDTRALSKNSFFWKNALQISRQNGCAALIVTNSIFTGRGRFLALKKDAENLFIIRKYYYFSFKKHVMRELDGKMILIF